MQVFAVFARHKKRVIAGFAAGSLFPIFYMC